jgi:hypothetical protein
MPYKSKAQAAFMHIHHPGIAKRWDKEHHESNPGTLPEHVAGSSYAKSSSLRNELVKRAVKKHK